MDTERHLQNVDVERAIIGVLLDGRHKAAWPTLVIACPTALYFTDRLCRMVALIMFSMAQRGIPIDGTSVVTEMSQVSHQDALDALALLTDPLARRVPTWARLPAGHMAESLLSNVGGGNAVLNIMSEAAPFSGFEKTVEHLKRYYDTRQAKALLEKALAKITEPSGVSKLEDIIAGSVSDMCRLAGNGLSDRGLTECMEALAVEGEPELLQQKADWPLESLNRMAPMRAGNLVVLGGYRSGGKTSFMVQTAWHTAKLRGKGAVAIASLEMMGEEIAVKLISAELGISQTAIERGHMTAEQRQQVKDAARNWREHDVIIRDHSDNWTADGIIAWIKQRHQLSGGKLSLAVIDHLQLIAKAKGHRTEYDVLSDATPRLKQLAASLRIVVMAVSQFSKSGTAAIKDKQGIVTAIPEPTLDDLRGSGTIAQDANSVVLLWPRAKETTFILAKNRSGPSGRFDAHFEARMGQVFREKELAAEIPEGRAHHYGKPHDGEDLWKA